MAVNAIGLSGGRSLRDIGCSGLRVSNLLVISKLCHPAVAAVLTFGLMGFVFLWLKAVSFS